MNLQALDLMLGQKGTVNPKELSPLALAYIGDAVYEMLVRTTVLTGGNAPVNRLHKTARDMVNAKAQAEFYFRVAEELTEEEAAVFRMGFAERVGARDAADGVGGGGVEPGQRLGEALGAGLALRPDDVAAGVQRQCHRLRAWRADAQVD